MLKTLFFLSLFFVSSISFVQLPESTIKPKAKPSLKTIVIDPGHGGKDVGARGLVTTESQVALGVGLKLGKAIQQEFPDIKLVFTRTTDVLPGNLANTNQALRLRATMANEARPRGDLFISIHCNSVNKAGGWNAKRITGYTSKVVYVGKGKKKKKKTVQQPVYETYYVKNETKGTETFVWAADRSDAKGSAIDADDETGENVVDSLNILDLNSPEARIRAALYTKSYFKNSATFGKYVEEEFQKTGRVFRGGVKQRNNKGIWVLQATGMPSVLIETGFITNKEEEEYLNSDEGQDQIVENIMGALKRYKEELESTKPGTVNPVNQ